MTLRVTILLYYILCKKNGPILSVARTFPLSPICFVYFKSKKKLNYDRFVYLNTLGAARLVQSDLQIYRIWFSLLNINYATTQWIHDIISVSALWWVYAGQRLQRCPNIDPSGVYVKEKERNSIDS